MTTTTHINVPAPSTAAGAPDAARWSWGHFTRAAAVVTIASTVVMMGMGRFVGPSLIVLDLVLLAGLWLMRGGRRAGLLLIGLINVVNLVLHAPINAALITTVESPYSFVTGVVQVLGSVGALLGAVAAWRAGATGHSPLSRRLAAAALAVVGAAVVVGGVAYVTRTSEPRGVGDAVIATSGTRVAPQAVQAPAGSVTVHFTNADPVAPRSFDIDELGVHVIVPPRTSRRVTFTAPAGTYEFYDQITFTPATTGSLTAQ